VHKASVETYGEHTFDEVVADHAPEVRRLAWLARDLVLDALPVVVEVCWPRQGTAGYGVGPKKMSEHFCCIVPHRAHMNLGFFYGAELGDPCGLLEGTGKLLRHVKLRSDADVTNVALAALVVEASQYLPKLTGRS
jgi:hypothetical protein